MRLRKRRLTGLGITNARAARFLPDLRNLLPQHDVDSPLRVAHFLAQVVHESGRFRQVEENLRYSAPRLRVVFAKYFPTDALAQQYAGDAQAIGSRVYANRLGNGDEESGEGFQYRGRGLIQLTGKRNYRAFSQWLQQQGTPDNVLADPGQVATAFPVHAAVQYWSRRDVNRLADRDDLEPVTRAINGGVNGLADREALLVQAKQILDVETVAVHLARVTHTVSATTLNLRRAPEVKPSTRIASLPQGTEVHVVRNAQVPGWVQIQTVLNGRIAEGFVARRFLTAVPASAAAHAPAPAPPAIELPPAHLRRNRPDITRARDGGRAFPLGESGRPRRTAVQPGPKAASLLRIIDYLDSAAPTHQRYQPRGNTTFCNIYAHDYCTLAGAYLPRVWWTANAIERLWAGDQPTPLFGNTVRELTANLLHDWLADHGSSFGWQRVMDLSMLQGAANAGEVCLIVAKRRDPGRSGHIAAVAPETMDVPAGRIGGDVTRPVTSQAGRKNHRLRQATAWWRRDTFQSFSLWRHA